MSFTTGGGNTYSKNDSQYLGGNILPNYQDDVYNLLLLA